MKPSASLEANRELIRRIVALHRGSNPRVFGSVVHQPATPSEREGFFAWGAKQPFKHEYVAGEVFAQDGALQDHVVDCGREFLRCIALEATRHALYVGAEAL